MYLCRLIAFCAAVGTTLVLTNVTFTEEPIPQAQVHDDGYPMGNSRPEGAATDLTRAYINRDFRLFNIARPIGMCEGRSDPANYYDAFLIHASFSNNFKTFTSENLPSPLMRISKVYAVRNMVLQDKSKRDCDFQFGVLLDDWPEIVFVDVVAADSDGKEYLHRVVVEKIQGQWYAHPALSDRYNNGRLKAYAPSTIEISKAEKPDEQNAK